MSDWSEENVPVRLHGSQGDSNEPDAGQAPHRSRFDAPMRPETSDIGDLGNMGDGSGASSPRPLDTNMDDGPDVKPSSGKAAKGLKGLLQDAKNNIADGAASGVSGAGNVLGAAAQLGSQGARALPKVLLSGAQKLFGPAGTAFSAVSSRLCGVLNISPAVGNGLTALFLALALGAGGTLAFAGGGFNQALWTDYDECEYAYASEATSSYGSAENQIPEPYGDAYTVCVPYDTFSYAAGTDQARVQRIWNEKGGEVTDETPSIEGRYLVATTLKFGKSGDMVDFYLDDGTVIPCIISDTKNESDAGCNEWGHLDGHCVLEFQYHTGMGYDAGKGNPQNYVPGLDGHRVAGWTNRGSIFDGDGGIISGATGATNSATNKNNLDAMDACGQRATFADNSTIAAAAVSYSYSQRVTYGEGYEGTELYKKVHDAVFPGDSYYRSCDRGTATAIRWSGADVDFPAGATGEQYSYCMNSDKWELVSTDGAAAEAAGELQPGDVAIVIPDGHIRVYVGSEIAQQVYESTIKGTEGDLGPIDDSYTWVAASIGPGNNQNASSARPPCLENTTLAQDGRPYAIFRCVKPDNSDEFKDIAIAGVTSQNSGSVAACECRIIPATTETSAGQDVADLAVMMAATASPETRIAGPTGNPWKDNGDPRIDNLVTIMDATLGAWGGNNAYASCCQAACGVIAAAADPDIAPSDYPGDSGGTGVPTGSWSEGQGGSAGPHAMMWYCTARSDLYDKVGENLSESDLEPGDILISDTHVMIYVGNEAARKRFSDTDANTYEASFADGSGGDGSCFYAGLTHRSSFDGFTVFRIKSVNKNAAHDTLNWKSMVKD